MASQKLIHQMSAAQFDRAFPNEEACCAYLVSKRWPDGVKCPRCQSSKLTELKGNPWHWQCYGCAAVSSYRFSHITGTIFENTNKPLKDWFRVAHLMLTSKKGMSALQICRFMGFGSYKTAWYMCHRIRVTLAAGDFQKFGGIVEVDETFVGGKAKNRHNSDRDVSTGGTGSGKSVVAGAVQRKGNVVARVIANVQIGSPDGFRPRSRVGSSQPAHH
jgi:transposase-like protein